MSPEDTAGLDFQEIASLIAREVNSAIARQRDASSDPAGGFEIASVRVSMGQAERASERTEESDFLLRRRYGDTDKWEFQLEMKPGVEAYRAETIEGPLEADLDAHLDLALFFRARPVAALKGIGPDRAGRLGSLGVKTVSDIMDMTSGEAVAIAARIGSFRVVEAWGRALLLEQPWRPPPVSGADEEDLHSLLSLGPRGIRSAVGADRMSDLEARTLHHTLSLLFTVLDGDLLKHVRLGDLRRQ